MRATSEARGEFDIELGGETYGMRPSHEAIEAFERGINMSKVEAADAAGRASLKSWETAIIVTECIRAWGRAVGHDEAPLFKAPRVQELLAAENTLVLLKRLELMLYLAVTGGLTPSGEMKAPPKTKTLAASAEPENSLASPTPPSGGQPTGGVKRRR